MDAWYGASGGLERVPAYIGQVSKPKSKTDFRHADFGFVPCILILCQVNGQMSLSTLYDCAGPNIIKDALISVFGM